MKLRTNQRVLPVVFLLAAAALPACKSSGDSSGGGAKDSPRMVNDRAASDVSHSDGDGGSGTAGKIGKAVLTVPENVAWIPWKMIGGAGKGASDGVYAGFDKDRMPAMGLLFSPINLAMGLVTGLVEGAAMSPVLIGPDDAFGRTMASPTKRQTNVWWYP